MLKSFRNQVDAGGRLGMMLAPYSGLPDVMVVALPGAGVAVAREVARTIGAPMAGFVVRKLGVACEEGGDLLTVASGGVVVLDQAVVRRRRVSAEALQAAIRRGLEEVARGEREYGGETVSGRLCGRTVIVAVDAVATGATMLSAIRALRALAPSWVVAATPVLAGRAYPAIASAADQVVCVAGPFEIGGAGDWYDDSRRTAQAGEPVAREAAREERFAEGAVA